MPSETLRSCGLREIVPDNRNKQAKSVSLGHRFALQPIRFDSPSKSVITHACDRPRTHVRDDDLATGRLVGARSLILGERMGDFGRVPSSESTDYWSDEGLLPWR
jgi:hypothetical protein